MPNMAESQAKILKYCIENAVFDGWTIKLLENACISAKLDKNYWKIKFPEAAVGVIDYYNKLADEQMLLGVELEKLRTPEKIKAIILNRLNQHQNEKEAIRTCLGVYALHPAHGMKSTYNTVDAIWRAAGDTATDWNFYSKRMILAGVYTATLMYWLDDKSDNHKETTEFLDRRLADVAKLGKFTGKIKAKFDY